jgi:inactive STAND
MYYANSSNLELLKTKLAKFQKDRIITADSARQFELDQQIRETEQQIKEYNHHNHIYESLLSLNYKKQVDAYKKYWEEESKPKVGSFFVSGKPKRGQRWLVNKLLHLKSLPEGTKRVSISLKQNENYIEDVWSKLSRDFNSSAKPEKVIESIYKFWQKRPVVIVLNNLDLMILDERQKIMEELWCPLVKNIQEQNKSCNFNLLMFLVDNEFNSADFLNVLEREQFPQSVVMQLDNFAEDILNDWIKINMSLPNFPDEIEDLQKLGKRLWSQGLDGTPEIVMAEICQHCGSDWSEVSKQLVV